jgi:acyl-CoA thioesterase-1
LAGRFIRYGALLLLIQLAGGCSQEKTSQETAGQEANAVAAPKPATDGKLVVAFGDSLFAGYNLDQGQGFAPALQRALAAQGIAADVFNGGVSGDTSAAALQRLAFTLDGLPRKPDLVIVGLGGNDMLRGLSPDETRKNMDAILTELKKRGIETMLTGMLASPNMGPDYAKAFNSIYPDLAKAYGIKLYPFFLDGVIGHRDLQLPDGIHPNAKGIDLIVAHVAPVVGQELAD